MENKEFITTTELAKMLGISRIAIFNKIKKGQIKAVKIGKVYAISKELVPSILGKVLSQEEKHKIDAAVSKTVKEYGETLRLLGKE